MPQQPPLGLSLKDSHLPVNCICWHPKQIWFQISRVHLRSSKALHLSISTQVMRGRVISRQLQQSDQAPIQWPSLLEVLMRLQRARRHSMKSVTSTEVSLDQCFKADGLEVEKRKKSVSTWSPSKHIVSGHWGIALWNKVIGLAGLPLWILYKLPEL